MDETGIGFACYPVQMLQIADMVFEASGLLLNQEQVMTFDPVYLNDWLRYRRYRRAARGGEAGKNGAQP